MKQIELFYETTEALHNLARGIKWQKSCANSPLVRSYMDTYCQFSVLFWIILSILPNK